jgi:sulfur relay (sulfurtransferase) DsrF/TusC family protein
MNKRILNVVTSGYRATLEEQDDPILWLTHSMRGAKAPADVLLRGNAVCYLLREQDASGLTLGSWRQSQPPRLVDDAAALADGGASVFYCTDDARERGIAGHMVEAAKPIDADSLPELLSRYDLILHW